MSFVALLVAALGFLALAFAIASAVGAIIKVAVEPPALLFPVFTVVPLLNLAEFFSVFVWGTGPAPTFSAPSPPSDSSPTASRRHLRRSKSARQSSAAWRRKCIRSRRSSASCRRRLAQLAQVAQVAQVAQLSPSPATSSPSSSPTSSSGSPTYSPTFFIAGAGVQQLLTVAALPTGGVTRTTLPRGFKPLVLAQSARPARTAAQRNGRPALLHSAVTVGTQSKVRRGEDGNDGESRAEDPFSFETESGDYVALTIKGGEVSATEVNTVPSERMRAFLARRESPRGW